MRASDSPGRPAEVGGDRPLARRPLNAACLAKALRSGNNSATGSRSPSPEPTSHSSIVPPSSTAVLTVERADDTVGRADASRRVEEERNVSDGTGAH